jgi:serine protease Do
MKKLVLIPIIALLLSGAGLVATVATYPVSVNGERLDATVLNHNGTTYLPLKAVGQALGADVSWSGKAVEIQTVDVDKLKEACVMIYADDGKTQVQGSAVCWDYGEYLTANHIILNGRTNIKSSDASGFKIDRIDPELDIATLTTDNKIKPVPIGDSDTVKPGDKVMLITSPKGSLNTVTHGTVQQPSANNIVVWANLDLGSSGGACFNSKGELIGIVVSGSGFDKAHLVVPINDIRKEF